MGVYAKRQFRAQGLISAGEFRLKAYSISLPGRELVDMASALEEVKAGLIGSQIPWMQHRSLGYVIYHEGEDANWLLTRVWLTGDIVAGLLAANWGHGFSAVTAPAIECVWESVVSCYERTAWVTHMMAETENAEGYLSAFLSDDLY